MTYRVDQPATRAPRNPWRALVAWGHEHPYTFCSLVAFLIMVVRIARNPSTEFEWAYVLSARNLVEGRGLYLLKVRPFRSFTYPPSMALLALPFAYLPLMVGRAAWFVVTFAAVVVAWRGAWRLAGGGRLEGPGSPADRAEDRVAWLGLACALPYLESGLDHQQTDGLIVALVILGCQALTVSRWFRGATLFGLAAGMKCTPLLFAPYLAWRGRWRAAGWLVAVAVGVNLLPDLVHAPAAGGTWLGAWIDQFLRPMGRADYLPGRWYAWVLDNQAIAGSLTRLATTRLAWVGGRVEILDRLQPLGASWLRVGVYALEAGLLAVTWWIFRRRNRAVTGTNPAPTALELSVVPLLMVLLSPMSSRPHFAALLLPALCLARRAVRGGDRQARFFLYAAIATGVLALPFWGWMINRAAMWLGFLTIETLLVLAGCLVALRAAGLDKPERALDDASLAAPTIGHTAWRGLSWPPRPSPPAPPRPRSARPGS